MSFAGFYLQFSLYWRESGKISCHGNAIHASFGVAIFSNLLRCFKLGAIAYLLALYSILKQVTNV